MSETSHSRQPPEGCPFPSTSGRVPGLGMWICSSRRWDDCTGWNGAAQGAGQRFSEPAASVPYPVADAADHINHRRRSKKFTKKMRPEAFGSLQDALESAQSRLRERGRI